MDKMELVLYICVQGTRILYHLGGEGGFDVFLFIKHLDTRKESGVVKGGKMILMGGNDVGGGHSHCRGEGVIEVCNVLHVCVSLQRLERRGMGFGCELPCYWSTLHSIYVYQGLIGVE